MKTCYKCGKTKESAEFHKDKTRPDGLHGRCKECKRVQQRELHQRNPWKPEVKRAYDKEYKRNNPHKYRQYRAERRVRVEQSAIGIHDDEKRLIEALYAKATQLEAETGIKYHVDHIIPISRGGKHQYLNLQILTAEENLAKGNRILIDGKYY